MSMKHNSDFIQLIPKELIVKQECNKISETSYIYTNYYEFLLTLRNSYQFTGILTSSYEFLLIILNSW